MLIDAVYAPTEANPNRYRLLRREHSSADVPVVARHITMSMSGVHDLAHWSRTLEREFPQYSVTGMEIVSMGNEGQNAVRFFLTHAPSAQQQNEALAEEFNQIHDAEKEAAQMYPVPHEAKDRPELEAITVALRRAYVEGAAYQREKEMNARRKLLAASIQNPTAGEPSEEG